MTKTFLLTYSSDIEIHFPKSIISALLSNNAVYEGFKNI
jgi:hypothetical protein